MPDSSPPPAPPREDNPMRPWLCGTCGATGEATSIPAAQGHHRSYDTCDGLIGWIPASPAPEATPPDPSSRCPSCGRQRAGGHAVDCPAIAAEIVREWVQRSKKQPNHTQEYIMADQSAVPSPATPAGTFVSVDSCPRHGFAMLAMTTLDAHGHGGGRRLLGPKSCCAERREVARWRVSPDDLVRIGADLAPPAPTPLTKDRPCTNCGHVASHDPPGCAECFDEPAAGGLCQTYVPPASQQDATEPTPAEDWRALGVTAIAAENPAVAEYLADLEARLVSLATRVGGVLDALAPPRFVAKCATKGCIRPVFTYDGDLCARCIAALPGASSECPICHRDTPHSHSAARVPDATHKETEEATPRYLTFAELVEYGRQHGANIVNGMPWSFTLNDVPITHENDECYLVNARAGTQRFTPRDTLLVGPPGQLVVMYATPPAQEATPPREEPHAHACPSCGAWCVCAEFYDGEPCYHHESHGCTASAPHVPAPCQCGSAVFRFDGDAFVCGHCGKVTMEASAPEPECSEQPCRHALALAEAAREINVAGPVAERIRILKREHAATVAALTAERAQDAELLDREYALTAHGQSLPLTGRQLLRAMADGESLAARAAPRGDAAP